MPIARKVIFSLFAAALLFAPVTASAQNGVGFKAGINMADFRVKPTQPASIGKLQGLSFGIYVPSPARAKSKFQTEILYSEKGAKDKNSDQKIKLTYADIAILDRIRLGGPNGPVRCHLVVGPVLSARLKVDSDVPESGIGSKSDIKVYDVGIAVGGDIDTKNLEVGVRYTWGFINILKNPIGDQKIMNRMLSILIGLHTSAK